MTDYDPNLPQEFAHRPKRRGPGAVLIALAIVAVFVLSALFAMFRSQPPVGNGTANTQEEPGAPAGAPPQE